MNTFGIEFLIHAKRNFPGYVAGMNVDRVQLTPRRLLTGPELVIVPEARVHAPGTAAIIRRIGGVFVLADFANITEIDRIQEQVSEIGVVGHAGPVSGADGPGKNDGQFCAVMSVRSAADHAAFGGQQVGTELFLLGSYLGNFVRTEAVAPDGRRLQRKRLRWPTGFAGNVAGRNRPLLDAEDWLAVGAIENKDEAQFAGDGDSWNLRAVLIHIHQNGGGFKVVVPGVMMDSLEVPDEFASAGVDSHERVTEKIRTFAVRGIEVRSRRAKRKKEQAAFNINAHESPDVGAGAILPGIRLPSIVAGFARVRHGVEAPDEFAGARVESANVPGSALRGGLLHLAADDNEVFINGYGRGNVVLSVGKAIENTLPYVFRAIQSKAGRRFAGFCIERDQSRIRGAEDD